MTVASVSSRASALRNPEYEKVQKRDGDGRLLYLTEDGEATADPSEAKQLTAGPKPFMVNKLDENGQPIVKRPAINLVKRSSGGGKGGARITSDEWADLVALANETANRDEVPADSEAAPEGSEAPSGASEESTGETSEVTDEVTA